jgi:PAS domain S-box-containing protein
VAAGLQIPDNMSTVSILIVEDESLVARDIKNMLARLGYGVAGVVRSGEEAVIKAEELRPSLVLMDVMLQEEMNGIQAAEQIYRRYHIPVIFLTAYAGKNTLEKAIETDAFGYILKPFNERELQTSIDMGLYKFTMESKLRQREQWLSTVLRSIGDAVIVTDTEGKITFMNSLAEDFTGWDQEEALGISLSDVFVLESYAERGDSSFPAVGMGTEDRQWRQEEDVLVSKVKNRMPIEYTFSSIKGEEESIGGVVLVFRDITQRKRAEADLKTHQRNLQRLSNQLINAQEAERARISRELHDEIGQAVTAVKINLDTIKKDISGSLTAATREIFDETETLTENILDQIHQISLDLRPSILDDLGLVPTLNWYVKRFGQRTGIRVDFSPIRFKGRLDPELETVIYRVVQEALTNVAKHAEAKQVRISLEKEKEDVRVSIEDDGRGFDLAAVAGRSPEKRGAGLLSIRERTTLRGGEATIWSVKNEGTRIDLQIPWREKQ